MRQKGFTLLALFIASVTLAIALTQGLNSSEYGLLPVETPSTDVDLPADVRASGSDFVSEERYGRQWVHYGTVTRSDRSFREMFIAAENASQVKAGQPLPEGTLILMETWHAPESLGTVFIKQKRGGTWEYGSFSPAQPSYQVSLQNSCHSCHAPFPETDFTLTKPLLEAALQRQQVQVAYCDRAGRSPCTPESYLPGASQ
ncbi:cytochrome P460 family protein [Pseudanabaena sp. FACHB-2040]|uniref:cytochrome P460 family protein n=1 Tax=Pseudanabaena sp. FACHB-2040 TaxID=2692859 RepID=UPI00168208A6|nr:cytochrome P460 family protein [Pseudanabaena sp. FACHB-2040]MBD2260227.1 cytochrome P460 family protein [Pseudanabaena sp. FACHB-2040]